MKHTTEYLYGISPKELISLPYMEALQLKLSSANELQDRLLKPSFMKRDDVRLLAIHKAIKFTTGLIEELTC